MTSDRAPGFVAVAEVGGRSSSTTEVRRALDRVGPRGAVITTLGSVTLATWGLSADAPVAGRPLVLSSTNWSERGSVRLGDMDELIASDRQGDVRMLPPFGLLAACGDGVIVLSDTMGFRQVFTRRTARWTAVSTSARTLAALDDCTFDLGALRLQSLLGWQLGQRTIFDGVAKLPPGGWLRIDSRGSDEGRTSLDPLAPMSLDRATTRAASVLRSMLERVLDEHPAPVLQLTGGQDSRLVLSAVPRARRRGLRVMTMGARGTPDVDVAAHIAAREGMEHIVGDLAGLVHLSPAEAFSRVCAAADRLDGMADPLAKAVTIWAEERFPQGVRLSGLGGELARGFYYTGRVRDVPVTRARVERLANWRMFVNEAVDPSALDRSLAASSRVEAIDLVHRTLDETGLDWYRATDVLYHDHRMQRWAGLSESAVCFDRQIVNPMLDDRFRAIADALAPADKSGARFLARLQIELDQELAGLPLDNRPAPVMLARDDVASRARRHVATASRLVRKVRQRAARERRPPAGGSVLASKVLDHLAAEPATVDPIRGRGIFDERWLDDVIAQRTVADPASLALLINVLVATRAF